MKIIILGAGYTGLELGRKLKEAGRDFIILEKESQIGGICRTNATGDYRWDFGVHALYSRHPGTMDYLNSLPLDYQHLKRNVRIFHSGINSRKYLLDYPFEIGVKDLPLKDKRDCVLGYLCAHLRNKKHFGNFEEWINNCLGYGIANLFMTPYNNKIWNCRLSEISTRLVSAKIEPEPVIDFILSAFGKKTIGRAYQAHFIYPRHGIQQLMDYTAKDIGEHISLNSDVETVTKRRHDWLISTRQGKKIEADVVISTIPLVELIKKTDYDCVRRDSQLDRFRWNNTFFVMVGLKKGESFNLIRDCHWAFFKEAEIFYRVTLMHNFNPEFLPVLVAEVTQKGENLRKTKEEIQALVIGDLLKTGILDSADQIAAMDTKLLEYTYPIPTVGIEKIKKELKDVFKKDNLFLIGRNGFWEYINMDGVIQSVDNFVKEQPALF